MEKINELTTATVFPDGFLIPVDYRKIRTDREYQFQFEVDSKTGKKVGWTGEKIRETFPASMPFVYLDVSGDTIGNVCSHGDYVVDEQKKIRAMEKDEVAKFRSDHMNTYPDLLEKHGDEPFQVIVTRLAGVRGKSFLSPDDKLAKIREKRPEVAKLLFIFSAEENRILVEKLWDEFKMKL